MKQLQLSRPHALLLIGIPGAGKSFFGEQFAQTFNAPFISQATLTRFADENDTAGKNLALLMLSEVAKTKATFVFDGDLHTRSSRLKVSDSLKKLGYQPIVIWVQTDPASARQRALKQRMSTDDFERSVRTFQAPDAREKVIVMSGKHTFASQLKLTLAKLTSASRGTIEPTARPGHSITIR